MSSRYLLLVGLLFITACDSGVASTTGSKSSVAAVSRLSPIAALPGYQVTMFTQADSRLSVSGPDSIAVDGQHVFIDYQNVTAKDCSNETRSRARSSNTT